MIRVANLLQSPKRLLLVGVLLVLFVCALAFAYYLGSESRDWKKIESREGPSGFSYINPLLECSELDESLSIGDRRALQDQIERLIEDGKGRGVLTEAAVYFRDLNNGPWFGINESLQFTPASLLKVPLAMQFYEYADKRPDILKDSVTFDGKNEDPSITYFAPRRTVEPGKTYTVEELIRLMLQESDNDATALLSRHASVYEGIEAYGDLGLPDIDKPGAYTIDVRTYASLFRILYNSTYLRRSLSEHMLALMSDSSFKEGLVAGVPDTVRVSQKFGERLIDEKGSILQLHNCGIIYAGKNPYVLCVMTQGKDFDNLARFIKEVSAQVYAEVVD